ncbi:MAG: PTS sugar transporter subunit IIC [Candidatus Eisenbacteria sp.]|jgi:mannose/fructose/N-acetylgalactosamine-specific phosphotransferase system component IIC|nr:PTS sugar transporter subunit IIC [Candidatus Eisenbacteria bacterium]
MSEIQIIVVLSLLGGVLSVDATAALQVMLSQPLVAGCIAGVVVGDPVLGLVVGSTLQLVWIGVLPVGAAPFPDGAVAGAVGVGVGAILVGSGVSEGLAVGAGVIAGLTAGALGQGVTSLVRRLNVRYSAIAESRAQQGDARGVKIAVALGLTTRFVTASLLAAAALTASLLLKSLGSFTVGGVFPTALWAAPVAAVAVAVGGKDRRESWFLAAGFAAGLVLVVSF